MAESPSHKLGQAIGILLETCIEPYLASIAEKYGLYLDHQKNDRKARSGRKVRWEDGYGNKHDLDYVIEANGTDGTIGTPVAFIEVAWRRYTKHSRNKAQEIQGAVLPLAERYRWSNPFLGAVVAGDFTSGSLDQLRSHGFTVLHLPYESIVRAYQSVGIDVQFDERTPDSSFRNRMHEIDRLSPDDISNLARSLIEDNQIYLDIFIERLRACLSRSVQKVIVVPLYGTANNFSSIQDAMTFLDVYMVSDSLHEFHRYEVMITFTNGDRTDGSFKDKNRAKEFLRFVAAH